ncbi:hypothetical protein VTN02DRAFT_5632 [Thermoascus thermophilus]
MPGVIMDNANISGSSPGVDAHSHNNGIFISSHMAKKDGDALDLKNGLNHVNGSLRGPDQANTEAQRAKAEAWSDMLSQLPPELVHITHGFFPYAQLVNRSVQQCWNDLSDLIAELAEVQVPPQGQATQPVLANGKPSGNQSAENMHKKLRILDFAQGKRAEFIKLLVLSQWSRRAADVSKLIDLQGFIRTRHSAYNGAVQRVGDMKRDLVRAQVANPDLKTALEVLSKGKVASMPDLGYKPPKPLTAKKMLRTLQKINRVISARLVLHDSVPDSFHTYLVHDGRVTFFVPEEFEIDLSIAEERQSSQFFFIDIRFLFSPSSPVPKGRFFDELDLKVNDILREQGLVGCFDFLHNLVLTNKINILFRQAMELSRGNWSDALRVELLHRTLIVQYWALRPGAKSWLEIGVKSGRRRDNSDESRISGVPYLGLRWMRDNKEVDSASIKFDTKTLSMESILRSVIALHASHILREAYERLSDGALYWTRTLSLRVQMSATEPGFCYLTVQLTASRYLRVSVEPMSGTVTLSTTPTLLSRHEGDRSIEKSSVDDIVSRVSRLRCIAAMEEVESHAKVLGWETVNPRGLRLDIRRTFPSSILRFSFFSNRHWQRNWIVAATSSMDGDHWWIVKLKMAPSTSTHAITNEAGPGPAVLQSAQIVTEKLFTAHQRLNYTFFADLEHCLAGMLAIHANAHYLAELRCVHSFPPVQKLQIEPGLRVPNLFIRFEASSLPPGLQISSPAGTRKKSFIKNTIRLSFQGVDPQTKCVIIVAYGQLLIPIRAISALSSKMDSSVIFQPKGGGFAIRFVVTAGKAIITDLFSRLQQLECVLSILESLRRKRVNPQSLSLSRLTFTYAATQDLRASIDIKYSGLSLPADIDAVDLRSKTTPLAHICLGINFDHLNPHRRIKESLTAILNNDSIDVGLDRVIELLPFTLPLLRALNRITTNPSRNHRPKVLVTARNAKVYLICYPGQKYRFLVTAGQHRDRLTWILKDVSSPQERSGREDIEKKLRERVYDSKGDGWKGLGNGAVADVEKFWNLISELDMCFASSHSGPDTKVADGNPNDEIDNETGLNVSGGGTEEGIPHAVGDTATTVASNKVQKPELGDTDVIMID